jgi:hypothetical protein
MNPIGGVAPGAVRFAARAEPLQASAVCATGEVARVLAVALLERDDGALGALRGVGARDLLLMTGAAEALPWVDGVSYLGSDPSAPRLLLPTHSTIIDIPLRVFEAALLRARPRLRPPIAVLPDPPRLVSLDRALPIRRERLSRWLHGALSHVPSRADAS